MPLLSNVNKEIGRLIYNRLYNFLEMNSVIYDLQFGFRKKYSTSHLIHLTNKIREQLGSVNFVCRTFADFKKAFDIVDHDILTQKMNHYGITGVATIRFSSYLHNQYASINCFNSKFEHIHSSFP